MDPIQKHIEFVKNQENIEIVFHLNAEEKAFYTIELANLRRLGDTRFKKLVTEKKLSDSEFYELESRFRYKFKARIHALLDAVELDYTNNNIITT